MATRKVCTPTARAEPRRAAPKARKGNLRSARPLSPSHASAAAARSVEDDSGLRMSYPFAASARAFVALSRENEPGRCSSGVSAPTSPARLSSATAPRKISYRARSPGGPT